MVEHEYKGNSHRSKRVNSDKDVNKRVEKITNGVVKTKKKSEMSKLTNIFIAEDVVSVKNYIIDEVLLPAAKKAISDIVTNGIDMLLYGETRGKNRDRSSRVSYSKYYDDRDRSGSFSRDRTRYNRRSSGYDYDDVILETRGEAEDVLDRMDDLISSYDIVSVADLYDLVGIPGSYTDNKYGWTNLRNAEIQRVRDGYLLRLPKVLPID